MEGKQYQLNTADYSGLFMKLQAECVITNHHKRYGVANEPSSKVVFA